MGRLGSIVHRKETVDSTQKIAMEIALNGAEEGEVVSAEEQTAGRGRMSRTWYSSKGNNIAMSIILRPHLKPQECPQLTLLSAVAVVQAIEEITALRPSIKWPNDILYNGKKIVGILTEMNSIRQEVQFVILGIGVNVNTPKEDFPIEIKDIASSLFAETGVKVDKERLMQTIFCKLEDLYRVYLQQGFNPIKTLWEKYAISIGKEIIARTERETIKGRAQGITEEGVLLLKDEKGDIHHIYSADIEIKCTQE